MLYLFWFLGALIHLGFKFQSALKKKQFKLATFLRNNVVGTVLSLLCGVAVILLKDDIFEMFGILINNFTALLIGYTGDSAFKKFMKKGKERINEKLKT